MRTIFIVIAVLIFIGLGILMYLYFKMPDLKPSVSITKIYSETYDEFLYIKKKVWGITGDHQIIIISNTFKEGFEANVKTDYIYEGLLSLLYKFKNDTLNLYVRKKSDIPSVFESKIIVIQNILSNAEMNELLKDYKEKGIKKVK